LFDRHGRAIIKRKTLLFDSQHSEFYSLAQLAPSSRHARRGLALETNHALKIRHGAFSSIQSATFLETEIFVLARSRFEKCLLVVPRALALPSQQARALNTPTRRRRPSPLVAQKGTLDHTIRRNLR